MSSPNESLPWRLEWSDELSVHLPEIDAEHQRFVRLVNELNEVIVARAGVEEVKARMRLLQEDAEAHFAHEEALFRQWHYPDAEAHAQKHEQALRFLAEVMAGFSQEKTGYEWIETALKVKQVLIEHIMLEDMKYRDFYLASQGSAADA
ncbi:MAG: hemerythrin family protein [Gallionella sp.]|nr:hemerythrin family protein [Gallionella sp.]MDD4947192.1 hemerythrin family protein [Gallionella sp.]MDD5613392.1 hemerythrin family protein [Gallionella sp.]